MPVQRSNQLIHSKMLQSLCALAVFLEMDKIVCNANSKGSRRNESERFQDWAWFENFSLAIQWASALHNRDPLPDGMESQGDIEDTSKVRTLYSAHMLF